MNGMGLVAPFRAVLFDMDGVLVSSKMAWFSLMQEVGMAFRGRAISWEELESTFGQETKEDVAVFGLSIDAEELDRYYAAHFGEHVGEMVVGRGAGELLALLRGGGVAIGVVTNTVTVLALEILSGCGLAEYPQVVLGAGGDCRGKPAPDLLLAALSRLGVEPGEACMIGDSVFDREAARAAGTAFVGVGIEGDWRIEGLDELLEKWARGR